MKSLTWKVCSCVCVSEDSRNALLLAELLLDNPLAQPGQGFADQSKMQILKVSGPWCRNVPMSGILPGPAVSVSKVGLAAGRPVFFHLVRHRLWGDTAFLQTKHHIAILIRGKLVVFNQVTLEGKLLMWVKAHQDR